MQNQTIGNVSEKEVNEIIGQYVSYYEDPETIEVFSFGNEEQARLASIEVARKINNEVEYEILESNFYRLLVRVRAFKLYEVVTISKILSEYGHKKWLDTSL